MSIKSRSRVVASVFFLASAGALVGIWAVLLFTGVPRKQSTWEHVAQLVPFLFTESERPWFFVLMAVLPVLFVVLALWHWLQRQSQRKVPVVVWALTGAAVALSLAFDWPVLIAACTATYYAYRSNGDD